MTNPNIAALSGVDQWLARTWTTAPQEYQWLLLQTLATAHSRRDWIRSWPAVTNGLVLDLGCGPGVVSQEIAALKSCRVVGYDKDPQVLELAQNIDRLFDDTGRVKFRLGDILDDDNEGPAQAACVRFVAQYASDLDRFLTQVKARVSRGGYIAMEDIDDGYLIEYPSPPPEWLKALAAFQQHQSGTQGDRMVGRKLARAGVNAGLVLEELTINPGAQAGITVAEDLSVQFDIDRIERVVPSMIQEGLLTEREWYAAVAQYRASFPQYTFISTATVRILFRVP